MEPLAKRASELATHLGQRMSVYFYSFSDSTDWLEIEAQVIK